MLLLLGIILRRSNGLKRCQTLDIAIIGNLRRSRQGPPKYGTYVTAEAHHFNIFTWDLDSAMRHHIFYLPSRAQQLQWSCAKLDRSLGNVTYSSAQPCIFVAPYGVQTPETRSEHKDTARARFRARTDHGRAPWTPCRGLAQWQPPDPRSEGSQTRTRISMSMCPRCHFASLGSHSTCRQTWLNVPPGRGGAPRRPPPPPLRRPLLTLLAETSALGPSNVRRGEGQNGQNYPHTRNSFGREERRREEKLREKKRTNRK